MNRSVLICDIRDIRGKKLFCYHLWVAGEARAKCLAKLHSRVVSVGERLHQVVRIHQFANCLLYVWPGVATV